MAEPEIHLTYHALNKPLTIWGIDRRLFFLALIAAAGTFNFFGSLLGAMLMFAGLLTAVRRATRKDSQRLRVLLNSARFRIRYDPAKYDPTVPRSIQ